MIKKRFTIKQNGNNHTVKDNLEERPLIVIGFAEDEFSVYYCFHKIIDLLNDFYEENEKLKEKNTLMQEFLDDIISSIDIKIGDNKVFYRACATMNAKKYQVIREAIK